MRLLTVIFLLLMLPSLSLADCTYRIDLIRSIGDMKAAFRCLNDEIKRLEQKLKQGGAGTGVVNSMPNLPTPTISQTATEDEIKYDLLRCSNRSGKVECQFLVTRLGADDGFGIYNNTKIYDEEGNEHSLNYVQIANKSTSGRSWWNFGKQLISNVPTKVVLRFNGVSQRTTRITVLKVKVAISQSNLNNGQGRWLSFRDIALQK